MVILWLYPKFSYPTIIQHDYSTRSHSLQTAVHFCKINLANSLLFTNKIEILGNFFGQSVGARNVSLFNHRLRSNQLIQLFLDN